MEWYVYRHDTNKGVIYEYNALQPIIIEEIRERMEITTTLSDFKELLEKVLRYYYWSKCEHEIIIKEWTGKPSEVKIDVFDQLKLNWEVFCLYVWNSLIEEGINFSKKEEKEEKKEDVQREDVCKDCLCRTCTAAKDCERVNFNSCCGCRKTEDDMVTRCISFVGEDDKAPVAGECDECQCYDCAYKDANRRCSGCNYCENGDDFIPKGDCIDYRPKEDVEEKKEEKPIIEDCLEDCLCKNCKGKVDCGCVDCSHSVHDIIKSCRGFQRISSWVTDISQGRWICANCKVPALYWGKDVFLSDFCPHCGASMENCVCGTLKGMD